MKFDKYPIVIAALFTMIIFAHHAFVPSGVNGVRKGINLSIKNLWTNKNAGEELKWRWHHHVFSKRPATTGIQRVLKNKFNIPVQFSFNLIAALSLFLTGVLLTLITKNFAGQRYGSNIIILSFFYLSFPVFFAFYPRINSYDDPLQYLFLLLTIYLLLNNKFIFSIGAFSLACITRETSFLFYPIFAIHLLKGPNIKSIIKPSIILLIPPLAYLLVMKAITGSNSNLISTYYLVNTRFYFWKYNFSDAYKSFETFYTIIITTGIPFFLFFIKKVKLQYSQEQYLKISKIIFILNTLLVLISARAREARLFFIPVLLFIPLLPYYIDYFYSILRSYKSILNKYLAIILLSGMVLSILYDPDIGFASYFFKMYGFIYLIVLGIMVSFELKWIKTETNVNDYPN